MKYANLGPIWAQKRGFGPKFNIGQMLIDLKYITTMSLYDRHSLLPYIDDFPALLHRYLLKCVILGPIWAQKRGFGPKFSIGQMMVDFKCVTTMSYYYKNTVLPCIDDFSSLKL